MIAINEIEISGQNLPSNIEDLTKFVLIGRERLNAVRAAIRAIDKLGVAQDVHQQKQKEAQELAEAVLDAEVRIGELIKQIPKATAYNNPTGLKKEEPQNDSGVDLGKPKTEVIKSAGISQKQAERYQFLAEHKEAVEEAKAEARASENIVTRQNVITKVAESIPPKPKLNPYVEKVKKAEEEHKNFIKENIQQTVVSIKEVQKDKDNKRILADKLMSSIDDLSSYVIHFNATNKDNAEDLCKSLTEQQKSMALISLKNIVRNINVYIHFMEG